MRGARVGVPICAVIWAIACGTDAARAPTGTVAGARIGVPATGVAADWPMPARDYAGSRFSALTDITPSNAAKLTLAWTFSTGVLRGHEGSPLVIGSSMYVVTPYPNVAYAFDLSKPGAPLRWKFRPENAEAAISEACCDVVNRGAAYADGTLYYNLLDGHTVAIDAATGVERWRTHVADVNRGETMTMAPLVVHGNVMVGPSGGEMGVRGWIAALDAKTGRERWRAYNLGPDSDVKIGPGSAILPTERGHDLACDSWPAGLAHGGAAVWGWLTYDPTLNLLYYGTSNPGPWIGDMRPGDNKYTSSILARDPDTGELRWALQVTPHDLWDYDAVNENILADLPIHGQLRQVLVHFDRNGFAYTIDRRTGEVLVAASYVPVNWASRCRPGDRPSARQSREDHRRRAHDARHLPESGRRKESSSRRRSRRSRASSTSPRTTCAWTSRAAGRRTLPDALHRRGCTRNWRAWWLPRRVHGLGCDHGAESVGDQRAVPRLERRARHGGERRLLRYARRLVQGG